MNSEPLTDAELAAMIEREQKATAGPWRKSIPHPDDMNNTIRMFHSSTYLASVWNSDMEDMQILANADFIENARTDIPRMVAEVKRLRDEKEMYRKLFESALKYVDKVFQQCQEIPEPILPGFAKLGEDKFEAVVRLANEYKRLRDQIARMTASHRGEKSSEQPD